MRQLLVVLFLLVAPAAWADLTPTEKKAIKKIYDGSLHLDAAMDTAGQMVAQTAAAEAATAGTVADLASLVHTINGIQRTVNRFTVYIHSVEYEVVVGYQTKIVTTGPATAWFIMSPGQVSCGACSGGIAKALFDDLAADTNQSAGFRALAAAGSASMVSFHAALSQAVTDGDDDLTYANPLPTWGTSDSTLRDFGAVHATDPTLENRVGTRGASAATIGPHGNFVGIFDDAAFALQKAAEGLGQVMLAYDYVTNGEAAYNSTQYTAFGQTIRRMVQFHNAMRHALLAFGDIPINATECALTPVHLVARRMELLLSNEVGIPFILKTMADEAFDTLTEAMVTRPLARGAFSGTGSPGGWHSITLTAWRYSDGAAFAALEFSIARVVTLRNLRRQMTHPPNNHVAPLCS